jgi:hypothetical protein
MSMYQAVDELEKALVQLLGDNRRLLELLRKQKEAMGSLRASAMEQFSLEQERIRVRIQSGEARRRSLTLSAAAALKIGIPAGTEPSLTQIAEAVIDTGRRGRLLGIRDELRRVLAEVGSASYVAGRVAGSVLGHLNLAMRLMSSAMRDAGTYTRTGSPRVGMGSGRTGALEMVG